MRIGSNIKFFLFFCSVCVFSQYAMDYEEFPSLMPSGYFSEEYEQKFLSSNDEEQSFSFVSAYGLRPVALEQVEKEAEAIKAIVMPNVPDWARGSLPCLIPHSEALQDKKIEPLVQEVFGDTQSEEIVRSHDRLVCALQLARPAFFFPLQQLQYIMRFLYKEALQRGLSMNWQLLLKQTQMSGDLPAPESKSTSVGPSSQSKDLLASQVRLLREQEPEAIIGSYDSLASYLVSQLPQYGYHLNHLTLIMHSFYDEAKKRGLSECWHQQQAEAFYMRKLGEKERGEES